MGCEVHRGGGINEIKHLEDKYIAPLLLAHSARQVGSNAPLKKTKDHGTASTEEYHGAPPAAYKSPFYVIKTCVTMP